MNSKLKSETSKDYSVLHIALRLLWVEHLLHLNLSTLLGASLVQVVCGRGLVVAHTSESLVGIGPFEEDAVEAHYNEVAPVEVEHDVN